MHHHIRSRVEKHHNYGENKLSSSYPDHFISTKNFTILSLINSRIANKEFDPNVYLEIKMNGNEKLPLYLAIGNLELIIRNLVYIVYDDYG